ncbi:hypothetical protein [Tunturiibacter gelidiferens]|uniref:Uncharacterized protein n=1 Tax=Tunturiibacter gelidiferens TaxID=3069689 RepID=A0AAU7YYW8_9BACT
MIRRALLHFFLPFSLITPSLAQRTTKNRDLPITSQAPIQVELLAALDVGKLSPGASVFAKARVDWNQPNCHLRAGSMVVGHVVDLEKRSKLNKGSSLTVAFDHADCDGHISPLPLTLFALIAVPHVDEGIPLADTGARFGAASSNPHFGMGRSTAPAPPPVNSKDDMSVRGNSVEDKTPKVIQAGQVIGLKKVTLSVGTGPDGASVLSSLKDNIRLEGATQLILMPQSSIVVRPGPALEAKSDSPALGSESPSPALAPAPAPPPPPPPPPEIDETSICTTSCSTVPTETSTVSANASLSISAALFGFSPHDSREFSAFDYESTVTYLDSQNLLFTYDPHKLRQRFPAGIRTESMRTIRAVLLDPATLKVKKIVDWQVQGEGQFIWHGASGQILVHLGHHLRLLDSDLNVVRETSIPGQLVFVSTSPSGEFVAVGTLHERHTATMHAELAHDTHIEPEEDIDIRLFDQNFELLLTSRQTSALPPPVLSDTGEVRVNSTGRNRWRIREFRWDRTEHTIANLTSACRPDLATPLTGSVFLVGCSDSPLQNWYRLIRLDGHPILTGKGSSDEIEQSSSSTNQNDVAVRVVRAHSSRARGQTFKKQDLKEQEISVYRVSDGKRLFFSLNPDVSLAEQSFALSPDGAQLAILSGINISLYTVAKATQ